MERSFAYNDSLQRIMRERANKDRELRPKKEHDGYVVLVSQQWNEQGKAIYWKSTIQTPFDATIPYAEVCAPVMRNLDNGVLYDIGCRMRSSEAENGVYREFKGDGEETCNGMYKWRCRANFKTKLWELDIYTTAPITVPEYRVLGFLKTKNE